MAGLQKQPITIPILGLDTHADPKSAPPGSLVLAENVYYERGTAGGVETVKRNGTTSRTRNILGGGLVTNARKLATFGNEELLVTDTQLYSWSSVANAWIAKGFLTPIGLTGVQVADSLRGRFSPDAAIGGGYACFTAVEQDFSAHPALKVTVIDLSTGARVIADVSTGLTTDIGYTAHVVALANSFLIVARDTGVLSAVKIAFATPSTISGVTVVANNAANFARWDMVRVGTADQAAIAYNGNAANQFRSILWNSNMTSAGSFLAGEQPDGGMGWLLHDYLDGFAYVAYIDSTRGTKVIKVDVASWTVSSTTLVDPAVVGNITHITGMRAAGANTLFIETFTGLGYKDKLQRSTGGAFADWHRGLILWSRVFKQGASYYLGVGYSDGLNDKYFVLDATGATPHVVATAFDGEAGFEGGVAGQLASVPAISSTVLAMPVNVFTDNVQDPVNGTQEQVGVWYLRLDFAPVLSEPKQIGGSLLLPGAIVRAYDGQATTELGFPVSPFVDSHGGSGGGSITLLSSIEYCFTYLWLDAQEQEHRSAPSVPITSTLTGALNSIHATVTNLRIGDKPAPVLIEFWASTNGGTTLYLQQQIANDPTVDTTTFTLLTNPVTNLGVLYTTGRALPHNALPPASLIEVWGDRAFLGSTERSGDLWPSDEIAGGTGVSFSSANVLPLPREDGATSSLNEFDDRLVIGKDSGAIYQLSGSGPAANGDGQYQIPARINSVIGPASQNGVIKTTNGLMFKTSHGLYLLPRGGADPVRLEKIQGYDSLTITGASNVAGKEQMRLVTAEGRTLVYHYGLPDEKGQGRWSTFTGQAAVDCANVAGGWAYLSSDGTVHVETAGTWADDGVAFVRNERFAWVTGGGILNNLRVYNTALLGEVRASCAVIGTLAYDYDETVVDTQSEAVTAATKGVLKMAGSRGRMSAVQLSLSETGITEGYRLTEIGMEIGAKPGFAKSAAAAFLA